MRILPWIAVLAFGAVLVGCGAPADDPSSVHDLRVLAATMEPPERMTPDCASFDNPPDTLFDGPTTMTALVVDPTGAGRNLDFTLSACVDATNDPRCDLNPAETVLVGSGSQPAGTWVFSVDPASLQLADGSRLWKQILARDPAAGRAGFWLPLVLHLKAGTDDIYAQKLMVYSCALFPDSAPNHNPQLSPLDRNGAVWDPGDTSPFNDTLVLSLEPFDDRTESYVEPSATFQPVELKEGWDISWHSTLGTFNPAESKGATGTAADGRRSTTWDPDDTPATPAVKFWVVVRDGRGGVAWLERTADRVTGSP